MSRKIIITNNLRFLKKHLRNTKKDIVYLIIEENNRANLFRNCLLSMPNAYEISARDIIKEEKFVKEYSRLVYKLNMKNASRDWWAMNFTSKNPLLTSLCKNIFNFLSIKRLIEIKSNDNIIVFMSNGHLARFVNVWLRQKGISANIKVSFKPDAKSTLYTIPTFAIFFSFFKLALRMSASKLFFKLPFAHSKIDNLIITHFIGSSSKRDRSCRDIFFGRLGKLINKEGKTSIICGYVICAFKNVLIKRKYMQSNSEYPLEYFLSSVGLLRCLKDSICAYFKRHLVSGNANIDGEDVLWLIKNEIDNAFNSGQVFINLFVYYSVKDILRKIHPSKILYPFENRSWEKLILLTARKMQKDIKLAGYQHASLTPKHVSFILEKEEATNIPFPDEIISMGKITKNLLEDFFGFPKDFVKLGCALRQEKAFPNEKNCKSKSKGFTLFAALASNLDEYVRTLRFLDKAKLNKDYIIKIRPHPAIDFNKALNAYRPNKLEFQLDNDKNLYDSLKNSNIVLYASSTVGIEALTLGKPIIYLDFGNFINSDPLFNFFEFKWACKRPEDLSGIIDEINSLDKDILKQRKEKGSLYARDYFYPVNNENMRPFLEI